MKIYCLFVFLIVFVCFIIRIYYLGFCLASETVKTHLIVSVGEAAYLALPRGGVHEQHVLIIPIACVPSRVHMSALAKAELQRYETALQSMYRVSDAVSLRFERSLRTKGKDHSQVLYERYLI